MTRTDKYMVARGAERVPKVLSKGSPRLGNRGLASTRLIGRVGWDKAERAERKSTTSLWDALHTQPAHPYLGHPINPRLGSRGLTIAEWFTPLAYRMAKKANHTAYLKARSLPKVLHLILVAICMLGMVGCSDNDDVSALSGPVPVYLHVSADILGDLNATRATDPYAEKGEFMNTLCVFVVDEKGTIEAKFGPETILEGYDDALTGDLTDWTSDRIVLDAGTYTIYAFSNWNYMESEEWETLIAKEVGETIEATDLQFTVDDPASKVDIANGKYIPMSGDTTVTIGADLNYNQLISVGMDRLVGKVTIAVNGDSEADVVLGDFSFTGWADKVPMMSDDETEYEIAFENGYSVELDKTISAEATNVQIASFYVNETYRPTSSGTDYDGFDITLQTNRYGGVTYTATTVRTEIPRNHIYPILLTLDTYELVLTPTAWTSILGVDAELVYTSPIYFEDNTYYISMLDVTSTFSITPSLLRNGTDEVSPVSWDWTYLNDKQDESTYSIDSSTSAITVTTLTATPGYEYGFTLVGEWTANEGVTLHSRTYNVKVVFEEGFPSAFKASRAWWTRSYGSELLRMKVR